MALETYKAKRNFKRSPEPTGGKPVDNKLHFVIQKHHASHLHYDFRLEIRGILKSWAVPKGPSIDPTEKRLAMETEDHPFDYLNFEGIIPSGYGAGTVIVWDQGTYETTEITDKNKTAQEKSLLSQYWSKCEIKLRLHGHKIKGEFILKKAKEKGSKSWYLLKVKDKYASAKDITLKDKSVLSKKTLDQMQKEPEGKWESHKPAVKSKKKKEGPSDEISALIKKGTKAAMPEKIEPMAATLIKEPFTDPQWIYELKLDGYRIIATVKNPKIRLSSRSGLNYTEKYPLVVEAFKDLKYDAVIDGELVVLDNDGSSNFDKLQKYKGTCDLVFYALDIIWINGYDVTGLDLLERKSILKELFPTVGTIRYTEHVTNGIGLFELTQKRGLEGIVAKRIGSSYQECPKGKKSKDWLKLPTEKRQEFVIAGWTESESGKPFRSLLFGAYENGKLMSIGHAGHGFKDKEMPGILAELKKIEIKKNPFANQVDAETKVHYVKPVKVANISFATWTASGKIRKPAKFLGWRDDKDPATVVREVPLSEKQEDRVVHGNSETTGEEKTLDYPDSKGKEWDSNWKELEGQEVTSSVEGLVDGKILTLVNKEKILWNEKQAGDGKVIQPAVTKQDLMIYYDEISKYILPYLKDRPLSLHVKHKSPTAPGLYIKDMEGRQPEWAEIYSTRRKNPAPGKRPVIDYLVCQDRATLLFQVNLGCIDINPQTSRTTDYLHPDYIIIDLDPTDDDFKKVIQTALIAKEFFDKHKLRAIPKTSGKTGLHLFLPSVGFNFKEARRIAVRISEEISSKIPKIATSANTKNKRGDKVFVDYNQNDEADTVAAPYSVRPSKMPTVSTPLEWKEINDRLHPSKFDMHNILERIKKKGDLWKGVMDEKIKKQNSSILKIFLK